MDAVFIGLVALLCVLTLGLGCMCDRLAGRQIMSWILAVALALAVAMFVYLVVALLYPEKFL